MPLDADRTRTFVDQRWEGDILDVLRDHIRIPNVSPAFDPAWEANGHMARATALVADWCRVRPIEAAQLLACSFQMKWVQVREDDTDSGPVCGLF